MKTSPSMSCFVEHGGIHQPRRRQSSLESRAFDVAAVVVDPLRASHRGFVAPRRDCGLPPHVLDVLAKSVAREPAIADDLLGHAG